MSVLFRLSKGKDPGFGVNIPGLIFENLVQCQFFGLKIRTFFDADQDPRSCQPWIRDSGWEKIESWIRDVYPGSATLLGSFFHT